MDGGFDEWSKDESDTDEPGREKIWLMTSDDCFGVLAGREYYHAKTGETITLLKGSEPVKFVDGSERLFKATEADMEGYAIAHVRGEDGREFKISPDMLYDFCDKEYFLDRPPLGFLSYDDMLDMPEPEWLIEGLIQRQTSALMFGKSNSFKSFLGIDLLMSVTTGKDWHGHTVKSPLPCVYVATEGSRGVAGQRIPGWAQNHGVAPECRDNFFVCKDEIALDDPNSVKAFMDTCAYWKALRTIKGGGRVKNEKDPTEAVGLVVIDIFGASMLGSESSDETARAWVKAVNHIMDEMKCSVLTIAHTGWADSTRARMHSHFWGSFDTRLKAEGDKESLTTVLTVDRHKDADSEGEWGFRMDVVDSPKGNSTLVPRLCDDVETKQKRRVSGKPAVALQALSEALIEDGRTVAGPNYPSCPVVSIDQWKVMCGRHGLTDSDNPETARKAFNRAKTALIDKRLVKQFDGQIWKVPANE